MQIRTNRLIRKNILSAGLFYYVLSFLSDNSDRVRHVFFPFFQEVVPLLVAVVSKRFVVTTERYLIIQFVGLCFYYISVVVLICGFFAYNFCGMHMPSPTVSRLCPTLSFAETGQSVPQQPLRPFLSEYSVEFLTLMNPVANR